jgi:hypothetical protein
VNIKELAEKIEKKAGVDVLALPIGRRFMTRAPDGKMVIFEVEKPWPIPGGQQLPQPSLDGSTIMALFQGDDEARVYTLFLGEAPKDGTVTPPPSRYTISKHQPAIFCEIMAIETFINEIADEWSTVDEGISTAERERAAVVAYLQENMSKSGYVLAIEIGEAKHIPDDEDEEDDEPEAAVTSAPTSPAS